MKHGTSTTGELVKRAGTTRKALRIYERAGLILPAKRTPAGYRVYALIRQKIADVDKAVAELKAARRELSSLLNSWPRMPRAKATVCAHIEGLTVPAERR